MIPFGLLSFSMVSRSRKLARSPVVHNTSHSWEFRSNSVSLLPPLFILLEVEIVPAHVSILEDVQADK